MRIMSAYFLRPCLVLSIMLGSFLPLLLTLITLESNTAIAAPSSTVTVTKTQDTNDGTCDADCSLREAIGAANTNTNVTTIMLGPGTYLLTREGSREDQNATGDLDIQIVATRTITLIGTGPKLTIVDGNHLDRVFHIVGDYYGAGDAVVLENLTIRNGLSDFVGGGVYVSNASLTLRNCVVTKNHYEAEGYQGGGGIGVSTDPDAAANALTLIDSEVSYNNISGYGSGGGIYFAANGLLTVTHSRIISNTLYNGNGAGIFTEGIIEAAIRSSTIEFNQTDSSDGGADGGGLSFRGTLLEIVDTSVRYNTARYGGGLKFAAFGPVTILRTIIADNTANGAGGIDATGPATTVIDSEIARNRVARQTGGIFNGEVMTLTNTLVADNDGNTSGGGVANLGHLTFVASTVRNNTAAFGGGITNSGWLLVQGSQIISNTTSTTYDYGAGAGLYNEGEATVTLLGSKVSWNTGAYKGGGIYNSPSGVMYLVGSEVSRNLLSGSFGNGGGIYNSGHLDSIASTISYNTAHAGGGIYNLGGLLTMTNTTISGNLALYNAENQNSGVGGGLFNEGTTSIRASTIAFNGANNPTYSYRVDDPRGSGIFQAGTIEGGSLTLQQTIIAHNQGADCVVYQYSNAKITSAGHNLAEDDSCYLTATGDLANTPALLASLADNGGPTLTHALYADSPAINTAGGDCVSQDQRGTARPQGASCDIGAVEWVTGETGDAAPSPIVNVKPAMLNFYIPEGTTISLTKQLSVTNGAVGVLTWWTRTPGADNWLTLSDKIGTAPSQIGVTANAQSLHPDQVYTSQITIIGDSAVNIPQVVTVLLHYGEIAGAPILNVTPTSLTFTTDATNPPPQSLVITSGGQDPLNWVAEEAIPWLYLSLASGTTPETLDISVKSAELAAGSYAGKIFIRDAANVMLERTVSVQLVIGAVNGQAMRLYVPTVAR